MNTHIISTSFAVILLTVATSTASFAAKTPKAPTVEEIALEARVTLHREREYSGHDADGLKNAAVRMLNDFGFFVTESHSASGTVTGVRIVQMSRGSGKRPRNLNLSLGVTVSIRSNNKLVLRIDGTYNAQTSMTDTGLLDQLHTEISNNALKSQVTPLAPADDEENEEGEKIA